MRSSVKLDKPQQQWGTIVKPEFGLGYQAATEFEVEQTVSRLNNVPEPKERDYPRNGPKMSEDEIKVMLERLTKEETVPDSDRRVKSSSYKEMGVVRSYAWQGFGRPI